MVEGGTFRELSEAGVVQVRRKRLGLNGAAAAMVVVMMMGMVVAC